MKDIRTIINSKILEAKEVKWEDYQKAYIEKTKQCRALDLIPFGNKEPKLTLFYRGNKFEIFERNNQPNYMLMRIIIDGIAYTVRYSHKSQKLLYEIFFTPGDKFPFDVWIEYQEPKRFLPFDVFVITPVGIVLKTEKYREHITTADSDLREFTQNILDLCRDFFQTHRLQLDNLLPLK